MADRDVDKFGKCIEKVIVQQKKKSKALKILYFDRWTVGFQNFDYFKFMMIPLLPNRNNYHTLNRRKSYDYIKNRFSEKQFHLTDVYLQKA